jgi:histamine receptor H3
MVVLARKSTSVNYLVSRNHQNDSFIEYQMDSELEVSRPILTEITSSSRSTSSNTCQQVRKGQSRIDRDRKAARSLFILVIVFLIFLLPYVICATASTAGAHISTLVFEISFWLLWLNSTCNPFLYPFIQIKYRRAYMKLFQSCTKYLTFSRSNRSF